MIIISAVAQFVAPRIICFALVLKLVCRKIKPTSQPTMNLGYSGPGRLRFPFSKLSGGMTDVRPGDLALHY